MALPWYSSNDIAEQEICNKGEEESRTDQRQTENLMEASVISWQKARGGPGDRFSSSSS